MIRPYCTGTLLATQRAESELSVFNVSTSWYVTKSGKSKVVGSSLLSLTLCFRSLIILQPFSCSVLILVSSRVVMTDG